MHIVRTLSPIWFDNELIQLTYLFCPVTVGQPATGFGTDNVPASLRTNRKPLAGAPVHICNEKQYNVEQCYYPYDSVNASSVCGFRSSTLCSNQLAYLRWALPVPMNVIIVIMEAMKLWFAYNYISENMEAINSIINIDHWYGNWQEKKIADI